MTDQFRQRVQIVAAAPRRGDTGRLKLPPILYRNLISIGCGSTRSAERIIPHHGSFRHTGYGFSVGGTVSGSAAPFAIQPPHAANRDDARCRGVGARCGRFGSRLSTWAGRVPCVQHADACGPMDYTGPGCSNVHALPSRNCLKLNDLRVESASVSRTRLQYTKQPAVERSKPRMCGNRGLFGARRDGLAHSVCLESEQQLRTSTKAANVVVFVLSETRSSRALAPSP